MKGRLYPTLTWFFTFESKATFLIRDSCYKQTTRYSGRDFFIRDEHKTSKDVCVGL